MTDSGLLLAKWQKGFVVRVGGRGTMVESPAFRETVLRCLGHGRQCQVVVDLSDCHYVDSTFLGGLIWLHKQAGEFSQERLQFFADKSKCRQLFSHSLLDRVLNITDSCPAISGDFVAISPTAVDREELGRHVEQCHRKLAELGGEKASVYASIAHRLNRELGD